MPEEWEEARACRAERGGIGPNVPIDSATENEVKHARCMAALTALSETLKTARPDVLLIFGDDQFEQFDFSNFPAFSIYVGETFSGFRISDKHGLPVPGKSRQARPKTREHWASVPGAPAFGRALIESLMEQGFDLGFSLNLPRPDEGIGHAFMRPLESLTPNHDIPTVPFFVNCYFGPQPTGRRCVELGRAIRRAIEGMPANIRVGVVGSGGMWHTPMFPGAYLDEDFDRALLDYLKQGDASGMGAHFDGHESRFKSRDPAQLHSLSGGTDMLLGYGGGTGEIRNWIVVTAIMDGLPGTVIDYVPVYASPVGLAFAHWRIK